MKNTPQICVLSAYPPCCCCLVIANIVMIEKKLRSGLYWPTQHNKDDINCVSINTTLASLTPSQILEFVASCCLEAILLAK